MEPDLDTRPPLRHLPGSAGLRAPAAAGRGISRLLLGRRAAPPWAAAFAGGAWAAAWRRQSYRPGCCCCRYMGGGGQLWEKNLYKMSSKGLPMSGLNFGDRCFGAVFGADKGFGRPDPIHHYLDPANAGMVSDACFSDDRSSNPLAVIEDPWRLALYALTLASMKIAVRIRGACSCLDAQWSKQWASLCSRLARTPSLSLTHRQSASLAKWCTWKSLLSMPAHNQPLECVR